MSAGAGAGSSGSVVVSLAGFLTGFFGLPLGAAIADAAITKAGSRASNATVFLRADIDVLPKMT
jgi:mevalonate kinase